MTTCEKIRRLAEKANISAVARAGGLKSATAIAAVRRGETSKLHMLTVVKLARGFGVDLNWLTDDAYEWPPVMVDYQEAVKS